MEQGVEGLLSQIELLAREARSSVQISLSQTPNGSESKLDLKLLRRILRSREQLADLFPSNLFADPAFEILLNLLLYEEDGKGLSIKAATSVSGVPPTTALRWIQVLENCGLVERRKDELDGRRVFIDLSPRAREKLLVWAASI